MSSSFTNQNLEGHRGGEASHAGDVTQSEPMGTSSVVSGEKASSRSFAEKTDLKAVGVAPKGGASLPSSSGKRVPAKRKKKESVKIPLTIDVEETPSLYERIKQAGESLSEPSLCSSQKRPREDDEGSKGDEGRTPTADGQSPRRKVSRASEDLGPAATSSEGTGLRHGVVSMDANLLSNCSIPGAHEGRDSASGSQPAGVSGRHHFSFEYRGDRPIAMEPSACEDLLGRIAETSAGFPALKLGGSFRASEEIASTHVLLLTLEGQREERYRKELEELKRGVLLRDQVVGVHKREVVELKAELDAEKGRLAATEAKLASKVLKVGRLKTRAKKLQEDLACSGQAATRREAELDARTRELAARTQELRACEGKLGSMGAFFRRRTRRMLKSQLAAFRRSCREQSEGAVRTVQTYLAARGKWEASDRLLAEARGAREALMGLQGDGVPVPESAIARFAKEEAKYTLEREGLIAEALSSKSFDVELPSDLGIPDLEEIDYSARVFLEGEEETESSDSGSEDEVDGSGEEEDGSSDEELFSSDKPEGEVTDARGGAPPICLPVVNSEQVGSLSCITCSIVDADGLYIL